MLQYFFCNEYDRYNNDSDQILLIYKDYAKHYSCVNFVTVVIANYLVGIGTRRHIYGEVNALFFHLCSVAQFKNLRIYFLTKCCTVMRIFFGVWVYLRHIDQHRLM